MGVKGRSLLGLGVALAASLALASTVFGDESGVDPRLLLYAMAGCACIVPVRRLLAHLPMDRRRAPALGGHRPAMAALPSNAATSWTGRVNSGTASARAATLRLVPALRDLARLRLADRRGISLDHAPGPASAALGPGPWALLRPDAARPMEAAAPGIPLPRLAETIDALERL